MFAIHYLTHLTAELCCFIVSGASTETQAIEAFRRLLPNAEIVTIEREVQ